SAFGIRERPSCRNRGLSPAQSTTNPNTECRTPNAARGDRHAADPAGGAPQRAGAADAGGDQPGALPGRAPPPLPVLVDGRLLAEADARDLRAAVRDVAEDAQPRILRAADFHGKRQRHE